MKVRTTDCGSRHPEDDVLRVLDLRLFDFIDLHFSRLVKRQLSFNEVRALQVIRLCQVRIGASLQAGFYRLRDEARPRRPLNCSVARSARNVRIEGDSFDSLSHPSRISFGT
jgi:hypothetical protein